MKDILNILCIIITSTVLLYSQCSDCYTIELASGPIPMDELNTALNIRDVKRICLKPASENYFTRIRTDEDIVIRNGKELFIQNGFILVLPRGVDLTLTDNSSLRGDSHGGSRILKQGKGTAVKLEDCVGCSVSNVGIYGEDGKGASAISIDENSVSTEDEPIEVSNVTIRDFSEDGIVIEADGVICSNLEITDVAGDEDDCLGSSGYSGVHLKGASNCTITNIVHTRSPGAVTLRLSGVSNNNRAENITVEQESTHCRFNEEDQPDAEGDPSLYISNEECVFGNYFVMNLLSGYVYDIEDSTCSDQFCNTNTVIAGQRSAAVFDDCNGANNSANCPE